MPGPVFGKNNWQFIFYVNVPITIFIIIAGLLTLPNNKTENVAKIDKLGILLLVAMILSLLYGLKNIDFFDFANTVKSTSVYPFLLGFIVLLPLFIIAEKHAEDPVMNLSFFTDKNIVITLALSFITGIVMMGMVFVPQFSENAVKIASGSGGYFVIILGLFAGVGAPLSGRFIDKYGAKVVLLFGFIVSVIGALFLIFVTSRYPSILTVVICLVLIGLGMGFTIGAPLNYMMLENTRKEESNSALATLSLVRSIGTTIAPAIMIGFLAHAGATVQDREMSLLPKQVAAPTLPYAQELTDKINKLKADPNMKDKLEGVDMPDLASMTTIDIKMDDSSGYVMPENLLELLKSADVTNITQRIELLASSMFDEMTPDVIKNIEDGVQTGIDKLQAGLPELDASIADLQKGADGVAEGIAGMKEAAAGMQTGIEGIQSAVKQQKAALVQMNALYTQINTMMSGASSAAAGMPSGVSGMPSGVSGMPSGVSGMPSGVSGMPSGVSGAPAGVTGMPASAMAALTGNGSGSSSVSIIDMIPASVKSKIPASVLKQLSDVKTPAELKSKINELKAAITTLEAKISDLEKQQEEMLAKISETETKHTDMLAAIEEMKAARADMSDTITKMTALKAAVPQSFETAKTNYVSEIQTLSSKLENEFQSILNGGFREVYLTTAIAAIVAIMILFLYGKKKEEDEEVVTEGSVGTVL
ncbi:MAG: MFS transporter [Clostridiales bacterium]|nr:MFS transporter [Clostridiales bacterium]